MGISDVDAMHEAMEMCSDLGYEMVPGFATHWAMGSDTLIALGHADLVHGWINQYRVIHRHYDPPEPSDVIDDTDENSWRGALGEFGRAGDWQRLFERSLAESTWQEVLLRWWPRLVPGVAAGLTHGLIRTTHAVRNIERSDGVASYLQLRELACGLGYWASRYVAPPAVPMANGDVALAEVVAAIPRLDPANKIPLKQKGRLAHIYEMEGWPAAVAKLSVPVDFGAALSELTLGFARVNLAHLDQFPVPLLHSVTAPAAMRLMLPHLPEELHGPSFWAVWQASASLLSTFATERRPAEQATSEGVETLSEAELVARALENQDEHVIKFTEACLREYAIQPNPTYLVAAQRMQEKIRPVSVDAGE